MHTCILFFVFVFLQIFVHFFLIIFFVIFSASCFPLIILLFSLSGDDVCAHKTKLGPCDVMAQNPHNAIVHLGHHDGNHMPPITQAHA